MRLEDPVPYNRKLHVELEDLTPGLKFDVDTDDGRLMVKPNEDRGITVTAAGIEVIPDTSRGIDVTVDGVQVKLADAGGLEFDGAGDLKADTRGHGRPQNTGTCGWRRPWRGRSRVYSRP